MGTQASFHESESGLEGSLGEASVGELLAACRAALVTGEIRVHALGETGTIELRAGVIERARFLGARDGDAITRMSGLDEGMYEVWQRLPDLTGELGTAAAFVGEIGKVPLIDIMRHCEDNALTCTITVVHEFDRGVIEYRAGEIEDVELNGERDEERILDIIRFPDARYRVAAPPLSLGVRGRRAIRRAPTAPFVLEHLHDPEAQPGDGAISGRRVGGLPGLGPDRGHQGGTPTLVSLPPPAPGAPAPAPNVYIGFLETPRGRALLARARSLTALVRRVRQAIRGGRDTGATGAAGI